MDIKNPTLTLDPESGKYHIRYQDGEGGRTRYRSCKTSDPVIATQRLGQFLEHGRLNYAKKADGITIRELIERYAEEHVKRHTAPSGQSNTLSVCRRLAASKGAKYTPVTVTSAREFADTWMHRRRKAGRADSTIRKELLVWKAALSWAHNHGIMDKGVKIPMPAVTEGRVRHLDENEIQRLLVASRGARCDCGLPIPRGHIFIVLALATGARRDALEKLKWSQVDLKAGTIDLRNGTVTSKRRAVLPLTLQAQELLKKLAPVARTEYVLGKPSSVYRPFVSARDRAGLSDDVTPHTLRHTKATRMLAEGVPIWTVAKVLGDTVQTVERTYGHCVAHKLAEAVEKG